MYNVMDTTASSRLQPHPAMLWLLPLAPESHHPPLAPLGQLWLPSTIVPLSFGMGWMLKRQSVRPCLKVYPDHPGGQKTYGCRKAITASCQQDKHSLLMLRNPPCPLLFLPPFPIEDKSQPTSIGETKHSEVAAFAVYTTLVTR